MKYTKELHDQWNEWLKFWREKGYGIADDVQALLDEIDRLNRYITALENCEVRSKTVIKRLRTQTGMEE